MDPLGLAFENFNALGSWRGIEGGARIDPAGKLIGGDSFSGVPELKQLLVTKYRQAFHRCLTEKLLTYALGRGLTGSDEGTVEQILTRLNQSDGRGGALIHAVVFSDAFLRRRLTQP